MGLFCTIWFGAAPQGRDFKSGTCFGQVAGCVYLHRVAEVVVLRDLTPNPFPEKEGARSRDFAGGTSCSSKFVIAAWIMRADILLDQDTSPWTGRGLRICGG